MTEIEKLRHSTAHVLATAVLRLYPDAKLDIGPPTQEGFFYDFDLSKRLTSEDLVEIEKEMNTVIKEGRRFERNEVTREDAREYFEARGQAYKIAILDRISEDEPITFYTNGEFKDLCAGPHIESTNQIRAFKLFNVAGVYYRGDSRNQQLQRIYGTAFFDKKELRQHLFELEERKKRDHRKLGKELGIFMFDPEFVGPGLPLWLPKGGIIIDELEQLAKETETAGGYERVRTPHIGKEGLFTRSGHLPYYKDSMYPPIETTDGEGDAKTVYYLKAMNCPFHHRIFSNTPKSYRDMPVRYAEYGTCYRHEQSGELFGLMRVRSMQMNDAHIYCTEEQFVDEFEAVNRIYLKYFNIFGINKYKMRLSTHDPSKLGKKYADEPELWQKIEHMARSALEKSGIDFEEVPDEAAFYGPKIDVQVWSAIGKEFTLATNQVDFLGPQRFKLRYVNSNNGYSSPLCIHRAPLGTHERFIGFLIEHFGGAFPVWLSPEQLRILPISEEQNPYSRKVFEQFKMAGIRVKLDDQPDNLNTKIRKAISEKLPYMAIIGRNEVDNEELTIRFRGKHIPQKTFSIPEFLSKMTTEIKTRARELSPNMP